MGSADALLVDELNNIYACFKVAAYSANSSNANSATSSMHVESAGLENA